jgi:hypothetical protein
MSSVDMPSNLSDVSMHSSSGDDTFCFDFNEFPDDTSSSHLDSLYTFIDEGANLYLYRLTMTLEDYRSHEQRNSEQSAKADLPHCECIDVCAVSTETSKHDAEYDGQVEAITAAVEQAIFSHTQDLQLDFEERMFIYSENRSLQRTLGKLVEEQHTLNHDLRQMLQEIKYLARRKRQETAQYPAQSHGEDATDLQSRPAETVGQAVEPSNCRASRCTGESAKGHMKEVVKMRAEIAKLPHKSAEMADLEARLGELVKKGESGYKLRIMTNRIRTLISKERAEKVIIESNQQTVNVATKLCAMDSSFERSSIVLNTSAFKNSIESLEGDSKMAFGRLRISSPFVLNTSAFRSSTESLEGDTKASLGRFQIYSPRMVNATAAFKPGFRSLEVSPKASFGGLRMNSSRKPLWEAD